MDGDGAGQGRGDQADQGQQQPRVVGGHLDMVLSIDSTHSMTSKYMGMIVDLVHSRARGKGKKLYFFPPLIMSHIPWELKKNLVCLSGSEF